MSRSPGRTGDFLVKIHEVVTGKKTLQEGVSEIFPGIGEPGIRWFDETLAGLDPEVVRVMMEGSYIDGLDLKALLFLHAEQPGRILDLAIPWLEAL